MSPPRLSRSLLGRRSLIGAGALALLFLSLPFYGEGGGKRKPPDLSTAIVQVAKQNIPAVVHIDVMERREVANPFFPFA